jgi:S-layer homology domain.
MVSEKDESVMEYSYDINGRVGSNSLTLANNPKFTRLNVPELRDTSGHWAEEPIKILASLNAISPNAKNFAPSLAISREEFAKAVAVVSDIVEEEPQ